MIVGTRPAYSAETPWVRTTKRMPPRVLRYGESGPEAHSARVLMTDTGLMMLAAMARAEAPAKNALREWDQPSPLLLLLPPPRVSLVVCPRAMSMMPFSDAK